MPDADLRRCAGINKSPRAAGLRISCGRKESATSLGAPRLLERRDLHVLLPAPGRARRHLQRREDVHELPLRWSHRETTEVCARTHERAITLWSGAIIARGWEGREMSASAGNVPSQADMGSRLWSDLRVAPEPSQRRQHERLVRRLQSPPRNRPAAARPRGSALPRKQKCTGCRPPPQPRGAHFGGSSSGASCSAVTTPPLL